MRLDSHLEIKVKHEVGTDVPYFLERITYIKTKAKTDPNWIFKDLFRILKDFDLWLTAYGKISKNKGANTAELTGETIDGTSRRWLEELSNSVTTGTFRWSNVKRIMIPKTKGKERPLGIPEFKDRVVQEVIRVILSAIYEDTFLEVSHGFRPKFSCHTALRLVRKTFVNANWIIEGDISQFYENIDHSALLNILERRINDKKFMKLIKYGLECKVIYVGFPVEGWGTLGVPQGGVLSPLLANIYLHELDLRIIELKKRHDKGDKRKPNREFYKKKQAETLTAAQVRHKYKIRNSEPKDDSYCRIYYVRYADDFIVAISGNKQLAKDIKSEMKEFLRVNLKLDLNEDKTKITNVSNDVMFLGYKIRWTYIQYKIAGVVAERRILKLLVPRDWLVQKLESAGYCDGGGKPKPNFRHLHQTQALTNKRIKSLLNGINEYYKLADDRKRGVTYVSFIVRFSVAKMYAAKFRLHSIRKVFKRGGVYLDKPIDSSGYDAIDLKIKEWAGDTKELTIPPVPYAYYDDVPKVDRRFKVSEGNTKEIVGIENLLRDSVKLFNRGTTMLEMSCYVCGMVENVEMHHIEPLHKIKGSWWDKYIKSANRKVVPLCRKHHLAAHAKS